jgi:hypothetical protein
MIHNRDMGGLEDQIAAKINEAVFGSAAIDPAAPGAIARKEFYSDVLAKTGEKFVESPQGQATIKKFTVYAFVPGLILGAIAGYWLASRSR